MLNVSRLDAILPFLPDCLEEASAKTFWLKDFIA